MNGLRRRRVFLQSSRARFAAQSETRSPAFGAYPRLSRKVCQRIQNVPECLQATAAEHWGSTVRSMKTTRCAIRLMRGGFCCGVHAVLRHFVNSAQRLFLMKSVQLIQRTGAFTDRVRFFDRL